MSSGVLCTWIGRVPSSLKAAGKNLPAAYPSTTTAISLSSVELMTILFVPFCVGSGGVPVPAVTGASER